MAVQVHLDSSSCRSGLVIVFFFLLALWAPWAYADTNFGDQCNAAPCTIDRKVLPDGVRRIDPTLLVTTTVDASSAGFVWGLYSVLENYSTGLTAQGTTENVALYARANKYGHGTTWAAVFEMHDYEGSNGAWAVEVDLMGNGPARLDALRPGVGVVIGLDDKHRFPGQTYEANFGFWVVPMGMQRATQKVRYAFKSDIHCTVACVSILSGDKICLDDDARICLWFDGQTGFVSLGVENWPTFQLQMDTGEIRVNPRIR